MTKAKRFAVAATTAGVILAIGVAILRSRESGIAPRLDPALSKAATQNPRDAEISTKFGDTKGPRQSRSVQTGDASQGLASTSGSENAGKDLQDASGGQTGDVLEGDEGKQSTDLEKFEAQSAVGRPFPLSKSVLRTCEEPSADSQCPLLKEVLSSFTSEPRDLRWARAMEELLESLVASAASEQFSARAIECRSSLCAIEVVGPTLFAVKRATDDADLYRQLFPGIGDFGFEDNPNGEKVVVTVLTFRRR